MRLTSTSVPHIPSPHLFSLPTLLPLLFRCRMSSSLPREGLCDDHARADKRSRRFPQSHFFESLQTLCLISFLCCCSLTFARPVPSSFQIFLCLNAKKSVSAAFAAFGISSSSGMMLLLWLDDPQLLRLPEVSSIFTLLRAPSSFPLPCLQILFTSDASATPPRLRQPFLFSSRTLHSQPLRKHEDHSQSFFLA